MIPTGSRLLLAATALTTLGALFYGTSSGGALGTIGLISLALAFAVLSAVSLAIREADVSALETDAIETTPAARRAPGRSAWPLVAAVGAVLVVIGLVTYPVVFILGVIAIGAATAEWMVQAWSERASASAGYNRGARGLMSHPIEFPVLGALTAGLIAYSFSRIFLFVSKSAGPVVLGVAATLIVAAGYLFATSRARSTVMYGVAGVALVGLVIGGAFTWNKGEREMHTIETPLHLAESGTCGTADETHADEKGSQTVAAKANVAAHITLHGDDTLDAEVMGFQTPQTTLTIPRATSSNVLFHNRSDETRRLVLDLGERAVVVNGDETDELMPNQLCTTLIEPGATQILTFSIGPASVGTDNDYAFFVPGVEGQRIPVVVP